MEYRESEHIKIRDVDADIERAYNVLVDYVFDVGITKKNALRFRLLTEEVVRLIRQIVDSKTIELWFDGSSKVSHIILECEGTLGNVQKEELSSIATTGEIVEEKGFFAKIADMFMMQEYHEKTWSLKEYQRELKARKESDKFSMEAWEDLERSLVANLADDIEITSKDNRIKMVVTKDFTENLLFVSNNKLEATSKQIIVGSGKDAKNALSRADEIVADIELEHKDAIHAKLIFEETVGMLQQMTGNYQAVIWLEKYRKSFCLKLTAKTEMDYDKKNDLLSMSTDHKNDSIKGVMDKIGDVIQNSFLNYEHAINLSQEYGGGYVNYGTMGMYGSLEGMSEYGVRWSLDEYKEALSDAAETQEAAKNAWDELEKSIVANIASDILVGVKGDRVDMTIICKR